MQQQWHTFWDYHSKSACLWTLIPGKRYHSVLLVLLFFILCFDRHIPNAFYTKNLRTLLLMRQITSLFYLPHLSRNKVLLETRVCSSSPRLKNKHRSSLKNYKPSVKAMKLLAAINCKFIFLLVLQPLTVPYFQTSLPCSYPHILEEGTKAERDRQREAGLPAVQGAWSFQHPPLLPPVLTVLFRLPRGISVFGVSH